MNDITRYWIEKFNFDNVSEIDNIDKSNLKNLKGTSFYDELGSRRDRCIILKEMIDKEKLFYILNNNNFDQDINNLAKSYYNSLDNFGRKRIVYKQNHNCKNR